MWNIVQRERILEDAVTAGDEKTIETEDDDDEEEEVSDVARGMRGRSRSYGSYVL